MRILVLSALDHLGPDSDLVKSPLKFGTSMITPIEPVIVPGFAMIFEAGAEI